MHQLGVVEGIGNSDPLLISKLSLDRYLKRLRIYKPV